MDGKELIKFEEEIKEVFLQGKIKAPIHLSGGNGDALIEIFSCVHPEDWVFSTHRSHFHALLKGIPPEWLKEQIIKGNSIHIMNSEYKFFTSAIVGGTCPIALGVAIAIHRSGGKEHVWCFIGDMASESGIFHECQKYARNFQLPISYVVEDNGLSTNTPTEKAWGGREQLPYTPKYQYERTFPHINVGEWVEFK